MRYAAQENLSDVNICPSSQVGDTAMYLLYLSLLLLIPCFLFYPVFLLTHIVLKNIEHLFRANTSVRDLMVF